MSQDPFGELSDEWFMNASEADKWKKRFWCCNEFLMILKRYQKIQQMHPDLKAQYIVFGFIRNNVTLLPKYTIMPSEIVSIFVLYYKSPLIADSTTIKSGKKTEIAMNHFIQWIDVEHHLFTRVKLLQIFTMTLPHLSPSIYEKKNMKLAESLMRQWVEKKAFPFVTPLLVILWQKAGEIGTWSVAVTNTLQSVNPIVKSAFWGFLAQIAEMNPQKAKDEWKKLLKSGQLLDAAITDTHSPSNDTKRSAIRFISSVAILMAKDRDKTHIKKINALCDADCKKKNTIYREKENMRTIMKKNAIALKKAKHRDKKKSAEGSIPSIPPPLSDTEQKSHSIIQSPPIKQQDPFGELSNEWFTNASKSDRWKVRLACCNELLLILKRNEKLRQMDPHLKAQYIVFGFIRKSEILLIIPSEIAAVCVLYYKLPPIAESTKIKCSEKTKKAMNYLIQWIVVEQHVITRVKLLQILTMTLPHLSPSIYKKKNVKLADALMRQWGEKKAFPLVMPLLVTLWQKVGKMDKWSVAVTNTLQSSNPIVKRAFWGFLVEIVETDPAKAKDEWQNILKSKWSEIIDAAIMDTDNPSIDTKKSAIRFISCVSLFFARNPTKYQMEKCINKIITLCDTEQEKKYAIDREQTNMKTLLKNNMRKQHYAIKKTKHDDMSQDPFGELSDKWFTNASEAVKWNRRLVCCCEFLEILKRFETIEQSTKIKSGKKTKEAMDYFIQWIDEEQHVITRVKLLQIFTMTLPRLSPSIYEKNNAKLAEALMRQWCEKKLSPFVTPLLVILWQKWSQIGDWNVAVTNTLQTSNSMIKGAFWGFLVEIAETDPLKAKNEWENLLNSGEILDAAITDTDNASNDTKKSAIRFISSVAIFVSKDRDKTHINKINALCDADSKKKDAIYREKENVRTIMKKNAIVLKRITNRLDSS